ncbi:S-layer homology domain-containing protein, partial [Bacillus sp. CGMCC 1.16607]|uniref:S-layer homology domain-containing protein n=1 Tax=Bacillus sp. CGMCC 1.16607 TaxID=3351842 RepID=UPI0036308B76
MSKSYKKFLAASVSMAVVASTVAPVVPFNVLSAKAAGKDFSDVSSDKYYYDAVLSLSGKGVINGFPDGTFKPDAEVTRSQAAVIIATSLGLKDAAVKNPGFKDVKEDKWYYKSVAALVEKGIISGFDKETFKPDNTVTRAELAKMLTLAYNLKASTSKSSFTDVPEDKWFANFVNTLVENKITQGTTATTFAPGKVVTRGQMAAFVHRAEGTVANVSVSTVEKIADGTVTLSGTTYTLTDATKAIFNVENAAVLKNAIVKFIPENGVIKSVIDLEIKTGGTANSAFVFDGKNGVIEGNVKISADNVSVKNLTVKGDFVIGKEVINSFFADKLAVTGKTTIDGETPVSAASDKFYQSLKAKVSIAAFKMATVTFTNISFNNSNLSAVDVKKANVKVEAKGATTVPELNIYSNATITADQGIVIPQISLMAGASQVDLNANVGALTIGNPNAITVTGSATIGSVNIPGASNVNLNTTGEIKQILAENKDTKLTLNAATKIGNLTLPEGAKASDLISNYNQIKQNIEQVGGSKNPDATPAPTPTPTPAPSTGGGSSDNNTTPPADTTAPAAVTGVSGTSVDTNKTGKDGVQNVITWNASSASDLAYYEVYRTRNADGKTEATFVSNKIPATSTTFTDVTAISGTYYYTVFAVDTRGNRSDISNIASVIAAKDQIDAPELSATASPGSLTGTTKIEATPATNNHLMIKVSSIPVITPDVGDKITEGTDAVDYESGTDINGVDVEINKYVAVYEVGNADGNVVKFKLITLSAGQINSDQTEVTYTVTFDVEGATTTATTDASGNVSLPAAPTKAGHTFKEWNTKADGTGDKVTAATVFVVDTTVYAIFTQNQATQTLAEAKTAAEGAVGTFAPTNATTQTELENAVKAVVTNTNFTVTVEGYTLTPATTEAAGSLAATVK